MKVLFITANRLGDAVLSTGLLDYITRQHPDAKVTVACGMLPVTLFEGLPGLAEVIILNKRSWNRHWFDLWKQVAGKKWDIVVDLRNSAVSRLIRAERKYIFGSHINSDLHKVEQNASVMGLREIPAPTLWFSATQKERAERLVPDGKPVLAIGPTANWIGKTWPAERFIELVKRLTAPDGIMPDVRISVFAAPGEETAAYKVLESIPEERRLDLVARANPGTAAAALARCSFYIGNDSGLMHCAAASGVPTLGLFGPSWPYLYRPWGNHTAFVSTPENYNQLMEVARSESDTVSQSLMTSLSIDDVLEAAKELAGTRLKSVAAQ